MGSLAFSGEDESQLSISHGNNYNLPKTMLHGCGALNHAVPRKLRSAIKKRGRESISSPLPIPRKHYHVQNGFDTPRIDGTKKSKLKVRQRHITKDEEEVAETLYALAGMFFDAKAAGQPGSHHEQAEMKSLSVLEEEGSINVTEGDESMQISSKVSFGAACPSSLMDSTAQQPEFFSSLGSNLGLRPALGMASGGEQKIDIEQVAASGVYYGKNSNTMDDKYKNLFLSPNLHPTLALSSETQKSCPSGRLPAQIKSKKSWKRCSAHVYITRLIKVLQISERKERLPDKPTQSTPCGGEEIQPHHVGTHNQMTIINGASFSGINDSSAQKDSSEIHNGTLLHKRPLQEQQVDSETSALCSTKQGYDFLSLGTGESINGAGPSHEPPKQYHMQSNVQSQDHHSAMLFSLPQNATFHSHNSAMASQQVQVQIPQYQSSNVNSSFEAHYNGWKNGGRDSASVLNYAHVLFPHLNAAFGAKYQHLSPSQQQLMSLNSSLHLSNMKRHNLPLGFERNGAVFNPQNRSQLQQLHCNQHL